MSCLPQFWWCSRADLHISELLRHYHWPGSMHILLLHLTGRLHLHNVIILFTSIVARANIIRTCKHASPLAYIQKEGHKYHLQTPSNYYIADGFEAGLES